MAQLDAPLILTNAQCSAIAARVLLQAGECDVTDSDRAFVQSAYATYTNPAQRMATTIALYKLYHKGKPPAGAEVGGARD